MVQGLGIGRAIGLLVLAQLLLQVSVLVFVAISMGAHGLEYAAAVRAVTSDPLPLGAAQLAASSAVIALGLALRGTDRPLEPAGPSLGITPAPIGEASLAALAGLSLQLPMVEMTTLLARAIPALAHGPGVDEAITALTRISSPLRAFSVPFTFVVVAPVTEELLFRGLLLRSLRARYGRRNAILATGLLFGAFHLDPQALVFASLMGVLLGVVADRTGSTLPSIALHAGFNAMPVIVPRTVVAIPGFNAEDGADIPLAWTLGSAVIAVAALGGLFVLLSRRGPPKADQTS